MSIVFGLKLALVPALIAGVTLAGRRWGPAVAGWLAAFPVVAAPILFFIALQHGAEFAAHAALGTLSAVLAILVFGICYAWSALRFSWRRSVLIAFAGYWVAVAALSLWAPSLQASAVAVLAALWVAPRLYPAAAPPSSAASSKPGKDIGLRMAAGALLVLLVTHFSSALGPHLSGLLAMFPVMGSVLVVFSHRQSGAAFAIQLLRGMVLGYYAFSVFCIALALALPATSLAAAFALALGGAVAVQAISRITLRRGRWRTVAGTTGWANRPSGRARRASRTGMNPSSPLNPDSARQSR